MKSLLLINSSGRSTRSVTRSLTNCFADDWSERHPGGEVILRDIGLPPANNPTAGSEEDLKRLGFWLGTGAQ